VKKLAIASVVFSILVLSGIGATYYQVMAYLGQPLALETGEQIIEVETGTSLRRLAGQLEKPHIIAHPIWLTWYGRYAGLSSIRAGEYRLVSGMTPLQLLNDIHEGKIIHHQITLVDGHNFREVLAVLHTEPRLQKKLEGLTPADMAQRLGLDHENPEGLVFPDTYEYVLGMSDEDVLRAAARKMQQVLQQEWDQRAQDLPYRDAYEALIMASLVEKETAAPEERAEIAGVFLRRLQKGMLLQTDPAVIYGLGENFDGNLTRKDLQTDTPYNTYTRAGFPPTPIAFPGREAIHAALHPATGDALYFVGRGDGHHYFSATLEEHDQAVKTYQLNRKKDYHSAPQPADFDTQRTMNRKP
jgi:UPF0755 protein